MWYLKHCKKELVILMYILNTTRIEYWLKSFKIAQIMIHKPGKNPMDVSPYRPINQLTTGNFKGTRKAYTEKY